MKRSLHILGSRQGGGAERFFVRLVQGLREAGQQALCILPPESWGRAQLGEHPDNFYVPMRSVWDFPARWRISRLIKQHQPDIVQTYMGRATRLTHITPNKGPVHIARLGGYYNLKGYRHAHAWVGNTQGICQYLVNEGLPRQRVFHIGNFVEPQPRQTADQLNHVKTEHQIPADAWLLVAIGRLHPNKGFNDLITAMQHLPETIHDRPMHLIIVGDGPLNDELRQQAEASPCRAQIHWAGWADNTAEYYQAADLFICPSRHEPLGNVILEAWTNAAPVLSTASDGARELIADGENGQLVKIAEPQAMAAAIEKLLSLPEKERRALGVAGFVEVQQHYSPEVIIQSYLELYEKLSNASL